MKHLYTAFLICVAYCAVIFVIYHLIGIVVGIALSAPVPTAKVKKAAKIDLVGTWESCWGFWGCKMTFRKDGYFEHFINSNCIFTGSWSYDPKSKTLFVQEVRVGGSKLVFWQTTVRRNEKNEFVGEITGGYGEHLWGIREEMASEN